MTVQPDLYGTCLETTLLVFSHDSTFVFQVDGAMIDGVQLRVSMARRQPSFEQATDASTSSWEQIGITFELCHDEKTGFQCL